MKKITKSIISLSMCSIMLLTSGIIAGAAEAVTEDTGSEISTTAITPTVDPQADVIIWKYMVAHGGHLYKRRWNETQQVWVDPFWILVS